MEAMIVASDLALVIVHYGGTRSDYQFDMVLNFQVFYYGLEPINKCPQVSKANKSNCRS
jgi:hypothetical protein